MDLFRFDFGYGWAWNYGHLAAGVLCVAIAGLAWWQRWPRLLRVVPTVLAVWAGCGFLVTQLVLGFNRPITLPTATFLRAVEGPVRLLDVGAGSGRASVAMLRARSDVEVTALDIYDGDFGIADNTPDRLYANAGIAGARNRVHATVGDMRAMPLDDGTFDAAISVAAIDHLRREEVPDALSEVARVLRPDGEFLLMVINPDLWTRIAYPFFMHHGYFGGRTSHAFWRSSVTTAGFDVVESGTSPATLFILARRS